MARSRHSRVEYAIKWFVSRAAFESERALYDKRSGSDASVLAQFLPKVTLFRFILNAVTERGVSAVIVLVF